MSNQTPETFEPIETAETFTAEVAPAYAYDAAPVATEVAAQPKEKKKWFCRILAFLLAVAPILIYFLVPIKHLVRVENADTFYYAFEPTNFFNHMLGMITGWANTDLFGVLPMHLDSTATIDMAITVIMYLIPVALVACAIAGIVAIFSKKAAGGCLRFITGANFIFSALYAIAMILIAAWYDPNHSEVTMRWQDGIDYWVLGIAGVSFVIYTIASIVKSGKWAVLDLFIFLLTAASVGGVAYGLISNPELTHGFLTGESNSIYGAITFIMIGADMFFLICAFLGIAAKKLRGIDLVRSIFMTVVGGFLVFLSLTVKEPDLSPLMLPSIIAAASAFLMLIIEAITIGARNSKAKKEKAAAIEEGYEYEEVAAPEAYAETAPVAETAEVEAPVAESEEAIIPDELSDEAVVLDNFLMGLTVEERKQFGALTLKLQKIAPDIPRYETGADNKKFFRRVFVNLGSVRGLIPDGLMEKIYQYTIQL